VQHYNAHYNAKYRDSSTTLHLHQVHHHISDVAQKDFRRNSTLEEAEI